MGTINERPIIMPLSNPTSRAECTAEEAARATGGRAIFSAGSPFEDVEIDGRAMKANQGNNFYVFPGLGLGAVLSKSRVISDGMLQAAALAIPNMLTSAQYESGTIFPSIDRIRDISAYVAVKVIEAAAREGRVPDEIRRLVATGEDAISEYVYSTMYLPTYRPTVFSCSSRK
jgi:malate dehydrogenase (decarboxylating)